MCGGDRELDGEGGSGKLYMGKDLLSHSKELPFYPESTENNSEVFTLEERCDHICIFETTFSLPFSEYISLQRAGTARSCPVILT